MVFGTYTGLFGYWEFSGTRSDSLKAVNPEAAARPVPPSPYGTLLRLVASPHTSSTGGLWLSVICAVLSLGFKPNQERESERDREREIWVVVKIMLPFWVP